MTKDVNMKQLQKDAVDIFSKKPVVLHAAVFSQKEEKEILQKEKSSVQSLLLLPSRKQQKLS